LTGSRGEGAKGSNWPASASWNGTGGSALGLASVPARLDGLALIATLLCPLFLLHGRVIAEALISVVAVCFLLRSAIDRDWAWLRARWVLAAAAWWAWLVACSVQGGLGQALAAVRFLLFVAALEHWVLRVAWRRVWLARLTALAALYIALQTVLQLVTGRNLQGYPRSGDGELTGPFEHPRAGAPLSRLLFPAVLSVGARWGGIAAMLGGVAVMVLIGQRMPLLLTGLGLVVTALLLPRSRPLVLVAALAALLLVTASAIVEPPTFYRLVTKFSGQMEHFPDSPYGQIAARAAAMVAQHPLFGLGFDGFRRACADPAYFVGWHGGDGGGAGMCVQHPHNHYLQAAVESGWIGLVLFCAMALAWLARLGRGLLQPGGAPPLRVGLFVAALIQLWPLASASALTSMPLSGWFFLLLGLGLAEAKAYMTTNTDRGAYV
jgi:O-antigen ligase